MADRYSDATRAGARDLWLRGNLTDAEIAEKIGVSRPDTIRDWRRAGDWEALKRVVDGAVDARVGARHAERVAEMHARQDSLGEIVEAQVLRRLRARSPNGDPEATAADLRALGGALLAAQTLRRRALGLPDHGMVAGPGAPPAGPPVIILEPANPPPPLTVVPLESDPPAPDEEPSAA